MTELVIGGRGTGRTKQCVEHSAATGAYIIVRDRRRAHQCVVLAESLGLDIPFPITYEEFLQGRKHFGRGVRSLAIDDLDEFVWYLAGDIPVDLVTWGKVEMEHTSITRRRLRDGATAMRYSPAPDYDLRGLKLELSVLHDGAVALQSLDDLGSVEANNKACDDIVVLQRRMEEVRKKIAVLQEVSK